MTTDDAPLGRAYRAVRAVRAHDDGPWPGTLVRADGDASCVLVDAETLGADWTGWGADPEGHILAPRDVVRRAAGHDAVLPVCPERLDEFVRRREARTPLTPGEAVTLGVSILRGCAQVIGAPDTRGQWWLDDGGRPVLATDAADIRALDASVSLLEQVTVPPVMQRTWDTVVRAVGAERVSQFELSAAEDALFALAPAEALVTVSLSPRRVAEGVAAGATGDRPRAVHEPAPRSMWQSLLRGVDEDLADSVSRATTAVWRRLRPGERPVRTTSRRAPWLVAGGVAAAVLAGGVLWPSAGGVATTDGPTATTSAGPGGTTTSIDASPSPEPGGDSARTEDAEPDAAPAAEPAAPDDLAAVAAGLLDARLACDGDGTCLAATAVEGAAIAGGAVDLPADERTITMLDDFGDLAVVRVDPRDGGGPSQLVVIVRQDEEWLLRDVRDVAQQP